MVCLDLSGWIGWFGFWLSVLIVIVSVDSGWEVSCGFCLGFVCFDVLVCFLVLAGLFGFDYWISLDVGVGFVYWCLLFGECFCFDCCLDLVGLWCYIDLFVWFLVFDTLLLC